MRSTFSINWNRSVQTRKQRKYRHNAPLHVKSKFLHVNLDKKLREENGKSIRVKKGDTIMVMRGSAKGQTGKVERVSIKYTKIYVTGIDRQKADGSKVLIPLEPSNLKIVELEKRKSKKANIGKSKKVESKND